MKKLLTLLTVAGFFVLAAAPSKAQTYFLAYTANLVNDSLVLTITIENPDVISTPFELGTSNFVIEIADTSHLAFASAIISQRGKWDNATLSADYDPMTLVAQDFGMPTVPARFILNVKQTTFSTPDPGATIATGTQELLAQIKVPLRLSTTMCADSIELSWRTTGVGATTVLEYDGTDLTSNAIHNPPFAVPFKPTITGPTPIAGGSTANNYTSNYAGNWVFLSGNGSFFSTSPTNVSNVSATIACAPAGGHFDSVEVTAHGCKDTFEIAVNGPINDLAITATADTVCELNSITLTANGGNGVYNWSTSEITSSITIKASDVYSVRSLDANNCPMHLADTFKISALPNNTFTNYLPFAYDGFGTQVLNDVAADRNGDFITVGALGPGNVNIAPVGAPVVVSGDFGNDGLVAKYDSNGNVLWNFLLGGTNEQVVNSVTTYPDNHILIGGHFAASVDFDPSVGSLNLIALASTDGFFARYNSAGNIIYARALQSNGSVSVTDADFDSESNTYVTGIYSGGTIDMDPTAGTFPMPNFGSADAFVGKYNVAGFLLWAFPISGVNIQETSAIKATNDGGLLLTGSARDNVNFDPLGSGFNVNLGLAYSAFVAKYNAMGHLEWINFIENPANNCQSLTMDTKNGMVFIGGHIQGTVDFDPSAAVVSHTAANRAGFVASYNIETGAYGTHRIWEGTASATVNTITFDNAGNGYVAGNFTAGNLDLDPLAGTRTVTSVGSDDFFVAKLTGSGGFIDGFSAGTGGGGENIYGIAPNDYGQVLMVGQMDQGTLDMEPGPDDALLTSANTTSALLGWYKGAQIDILPRIDTVICRNEPYNLGVQGFDNTYNFDWLINSVHNPAHTGNPFTSTDSGMHAVVVINNFGCANKSDSAHVAWHPAADTSLSFTGPLEFCDVDSVRFRHTVNPDSAKFYSVGTPWVELTKNPAPDDRTTTINTTGDYTMIAWENGCPDTAAIRTVTTYITPSDQIIGTTPFVACYGDSLKLATQPNNSFTYQWYANNMVLPTKTDSVLYTNNYGHYKADITNGACVVTTITETVQFGPAPDTSLTVSQNSICPGENVMFMAKPINTYGSALTAAAGAQALPLKSRFQFAGNSAFTIAFWVRPTTWGSMLRSGANLTEFDFEFRINSGSGSGELELRLGENPTWHQTVNGPAIDFGRYTHLTLVYDGDVNQEVELYVNGEPSHASPVPIDANVLAASQFINAITLQASNTNFDELVVIERAITPTEVKSLLTDVLTPTHPLRPETIGYYKFDEGSGTIAHDSAAINPIDMNLTFGYTGNSMFYTQTTSSGFNWFRDATNLINNANLHTDNQTGTYFSYLNTPTCTDSTQKVTITPSPNPVVSLGADTTVCKTDTLVGDRIPSGSVSVLWNSVDYATLLGNTQKLGIDTAGKYEFVVDSSGCVGRDTIQVTPAHKVRLTTFLQGAYVSPTTMRTDLVAGAYLDGFLSGAAAPLPIGPALPISKSAATLPNANTVDVIEIVLRDAGPGFARLDTAYAWLLNDGTIADYNHPNRNYARFCEVTSGNYYYQVNHRNHLSIMSATQQLVNTSLPPSAYNLFSIGNIYGGGSIPIDGVIYGLPAADLRADGSVDANDLYDLMRDETLLLSGYQQSDANLDGSVNSFDFNLTSALNNLLIYSTVP